MVKAMSSLGERYEQFSTRERLLIVVTIAAFLYFVFSLSVFAYFDKIEGSRQQALSELEQQHLQLQAELQLSSSLLNTDPDKAKKQQISALKTELQNLEGSLNRLSVGLIPADELPKLLKRVLQKVKNLRLQSIRTLPVSELSLQGDVITREDGEDAVASEPSTRLSDDDDETQEVETAGVFKHAVVVELTGSYFETQRFITALEDLPWRLYWDSLEYSVSSYPSAKISLQVYTLSTDKGAFGDRP